MASDDAAEGKPAAADDSKAKKSGVSVLGAGGQIETAAGSDRVDRRGDERLVRAEGQSDGAVLQADLRGLMFAMRQWLGREHR